MDRVQLNYSSFYPHSKGNHLTSLNISSNKNSSKLLVSSSINDPIVRIWSLKDIKNKLASKNGLPMPLISLSNSSTCIINQANFNPFNNLNVIVCSNTLKVYDLNSWEILHNFQLFYTQNDLFNDVKYFNNNIVVSITNNDVRLYDLRTNKLILNFKNHNFDNLSTVEIMSNNHFITGGYDGLVNYYDLRSSKCISINFEEHYNDKNLKVNKVIKSPTAVDSHDIHVRLLGSNKLINLNFNNPKGEEIDKEFELNINDQLINYNCDFQLQQSNNNSKDLQVIYPAGFKGGFVKSQLSGTDNHTKYYYLSNSDKEFLNKVEILNDDHYILGSNFGRLFIDTEPNEH